MTDPEQLVQRWFSDLFNRGDTDVADEILAPDVTYHGPESLSPGEVSGPEEIKEYVEVYGQAFPDLWYTVDHVFGTDEEVCVRWTVTGTHESDLFEMESTGEEFSEAGINVFTIEGGRITDVRSEWDTLRMVNELGILPPVGSAD